MDHAPLPVLLLSAVHPEDTHPANYKQRAVVGKNSVALDLVSPREAAGWEGRKLIYWRSVWQRVVHRSYPYPRITVPGRARLVPEASAWWARAASRGLLLSPRCWKSVKTSRSARAPPGCRRRASGSTRRSRRPPWTRRSPPGSGAPAQGHPPAPAAAARRSSGRRNRVI
jgi:hypothetical protein